MASQLAKQVAACNRRAKERGLEGSLTTRDWQRTLEFFGHKCVYCGIAAGTIDHFQSLSFGGGTTHSNCVPSCMSCNTRKASQSFRELDATFVRAERVTAIREYLEVIGHQHQESLHRLYEREPVFLRLHEATLHLKQYCEERAQQIQTEESTAYGYLRQMIFGVEWDPAHHFQMLTSLIWQQQHSTLPILAAACEDARNVLSGADHSVHRKGYAYEQDI